MDVYTKDFSAKTLDTCTSRYDVLDISYDPHLIIKQAFYFSSIMPVPFSTALPHFYATLSFPYYQNIYGT